jgi:site-specific recombinase XerD
MKKLRTLLREEIKLRGYAESTQKTYFTNVQTFINYTNTQLKNLTLDHVRTYKLFMIDSKKSPRTVNQNIAAIKFFLSLF